MSSMCQTKHPLALFLLARARVGTGTWNTVVTLMLMPHDHLEQLCEGAWPLGVTLADGRYSPCRRQENGEAPVRGQEGGKE